MGWESAREQQAKSTSKSGGGKLKSVQTDGGKGLPPNLPKSGNIGAGKGHITPTTTSGDKGIIAKGTSFQSSKAPRD